MAIKMNDGNNNRRTELKLIRCAISDPDLIEAFDNFRHDNDFEDKTTVEIALREFLKEEGYL